LPRPVRPQFLYQDVHIHSAGAILYASLIFGTLRAGCPVFPLSTRNSDVAIAHLIAESGVKYLLVSQDARMQDIARKANSILQSKNIHITVVSIPTYEEICAEEHIDLDALPPLQPIDDDHLLIIAHSSGNYHTTVLAIFDAQRRISGSTSFPKVIPLTQNYFLKMNGPRTLVYSDAPLSNLFIYIRIQA
jgi:acyl-CoA synthetase (AMP-forming)/AMP-acid ligase II